MDLTNPYDRFLARDGLSTDPGQHTGYKTFHSEIQNFHTHHRVQSSKSLDFAGSRRVQLSSVQRNIDPSDRPWSGIVSYPGLVTFAKPWYPGYLLNLRPSFSQIIPAHHDGIVILSSVQAVWIHWACRVGRDTITEVLILAGPGI